VPSLEAVERLLVLFRMIKHYILSYADSCNVIDLSQNYAFWSYDVWLNVKVLFV